MKALDLLNDRLSEQLSKGILHCSSQFYIHFMDAFFLCMKGTDAIVPLHDPLKWIENPKQIYADCLWLAVFKVDAK